MADIKSLQNEYDSLMQRAKGAQDEAVRMRGKAAELSSGGNAGRAQNEASIAMNKDKEAMDYTQKANQVQSQIGKLQQEASSLQSQFNNLESTRQSITGGYNGPLL